MGLKLRNKKTGEIGELLGTDRAAGIINICINFHDGKPKAYNYESLAELNEEWEDYKPTEPLIKDEKIRKAVRAWADANDIDSNFYHNTAIKFNPSEHRLTWIDTSIEFDEITGLEDLKPHKIYTIDELCGEEEE